MCVRESVCLMHAPLAPQISPKSCSFQAILREKPLFWANFGLRAPLGSKLRWPPWPKSSSHAWWERERERKRERENEKERERERERKRERECVCVCKREHVNGYSQDRQAGNLDFPRCTFVRKLKEWFLLIRCRDGSQNWRENSQLLVCHCRMSFLCMGRFACPNVQRERKTWFMWNFHAHVTRLDKQKVPCLDCAFASVYFFFFSKSQAENHVSALKV